MNHFDEYLEQEMIEVQNEAKQIIIDWLGLETSKNTDLFCKIFAYACLEGSDDADKLNEELKFSDYELNAIGDRFESFKKCWLARNEPSYDFDEDYEYKYY